MVTPTDGRLWREIVEVVMKRSLIVLTLVFAMSLALALPASAVTTTWSITGGPGDANLGNAGTVFTATDNVTQLTAQGFAFNSAPFYGVSAGNALDLHLNAQGLGPTGRWVSNCATDDIGQCQPAEFLRLRLPTANWDPVSVTLTNLSSGDNWEIYGDDDGNIFNGSTLLASGGFTSDPQTILFGGITPFQFIYIKPPVGSDSNCDLRCFFADYNGPFRVSQFVGQIAGVVPQVSELVSTDVPEAGSLLLLGAGLATLAGSRFVRRRRQARS